MKTYECPKCHVQMTCLGVVLGHDCPSNKSKWVGKWIEVVPSDNHKPRKKLVRVGKKAR